MVGTTAFVASQPSKHDMEKECELSHSARYRPMNPRERVSSVALLALYSLIAFLVTLFLYLHIIPDHALRLPASEMTVIDTQTNVVYVGKSSYGVESFLNIRFAESTGLGNRFLAPKPYSYPPDVQVDARFPGAACPQHRVPITGIPILDNVTIVSEDCLTLRIDRPAGICRDAKLPVLVWICGGGNSIGQIYDSAYDPRRLVSGAYEKDTPVIYVAMNYRLGIFGFSAFEGLDSNSNAGLLDQRLALEWIQTHIEYFGGDPRRVTIFGESAGGIAVGLHITAYGQAKNNSHLFQRAIMQSGGPTSHFGTVAATNRRHTSAISRLLNCTTDASELQCLQSWPLEKILSVSLDYSLTINPLGGIGVWGPTSPSPYIPAAPSRLLRSGNFSRATDIIIGWNEDDGSLFTPPPETFTDSSSLTKWAQTRYHPSNSSLLDEMLHLYPSDSFKNKRMAHPDIPPNWFPVSQIVRDMSYVCPALLTVQASYKYNRDPQNLGASIHRRPRRYLYELNSTLHGPLLAERNLGFAGVIHFSDIPFVFNQASSSKYNATKDQLDLASLISGSWATFAHNGSVVTPNTSSSLQDWPEAMRDPPMADNFTVRVLGGDNDGLAQIGPSSIDFENLEKRCAFWNRQDVLDLIGV